jgi:glycosyltransferase involved in cell wall biosynthesis
VKHYFKLKHRIKEFKPDIAHFHMYHHYLSPSVLFLMRRLKRERDIKVVVTMHNYHLLCANNCYMRWKANEPYICEKCNFKKYHKILHYRCDNRNIVFNFLKYFQHVIAYNILGLQNYIDYIVCPSQFMFDKMKFIFPEEKMKVIRNCVFNIEKVLPEVKEIAAEINDDFQSVGMGRLSPEKGFHKFIKQIYKPEKFGKLTIIGDDTHGYKKQLQELTISKGFENNIEFFSAMAHKKALAYLYKAKYLVFPSVWYENNPLVALEAKYLGKEIFHFNLETVKEIQEMKEEELKEDFYVKNLTNFYKKIFSTERYIG